MGIQGSFDLHFWITRGMARRMGVSLTEAMHEGTLSQAEFAAMITRCRSCPGAEGCKAYLADPSEVPGSAPDWCRNGAVLRQLSTLH
jgi:hypothetical protein